MAKKIKEGMALKPETPEEPVEPKKAKTKGGKLANIEEGKFLKSLWTY